MNTARALWLADQADHHLKELLDLVDKHGTDDMIYDVAEARSQLDHLRDHIEDWNEVIE